MKVNIKTIFLVIALVYILLIVSGLIHAENKLRIEDYGLIAFAILLATGFFDMLGEFSFGKEGVSFRLNQIENRQDSHEDMLKAIQLALKGLITKYEFEHLRRLCQDIPYFCHYGNIFFDEIRELDSKGFIRPTTAYLPVGFNAIRDENQNNPNEFDLKCYVEITTEGLEYVKIRSALFSAMK